MTTETIWQPAVIAPFEHVLPQHLHGITAERHVAMATSEITKYAGQTIRVSDPGQELMADVNADRRLHFGCAGKSVAVHPDDAARLWPAITNRGPNHNVSLCTCYLFMD